MSPRAQCLVVWLLLLCWLCWLCWLYPNLVLDFGSKYQVLQMMSFACAVEAEERGSQHIQP
jgi:hypothetical protein